MSSDSAKKQIVDLITASAKILIMPSSPPDGDSIGSALSLYLVLKKLNKEVTVASAERIPNIYNFLPSVNAIGDKVVASKDFIITVDTSKANIFSVKTVEENGKTNIIITPKGGRFSSKDIAFNYGPEKYDLVITVDCAAVEQLGRLYEDNIDIFSQVPVINIDHHISNEQFGRINYVDYMSSSTTEILIPIIEELEKATHAKLFDDDIATLLLAGIITDTGSFQNANTTPRSFDWAAYLIAKGGRQQEIIHHIYKTKPLSTLKLWGKVLSKIQIDEKLKFVWSTVTQKDFEETESDEEHVGEIIDDLLSNAPGAEIILLLKEKSGGIISGSIRTTTPSIDANEVAAMFGGGGHTRAAGFKIKNADFEKVYKYVIDKIKEYQKNRLNITDEEETNVIVPEAPALTYKYSAKETPKIEEPAPAGEELSPEIEAPAMPAAEIKSSKQQEEQPPLASEKKKRGRKPKTEKPTEEQTPEAPKKPEKSFDIKPQREEEIAGEETPAEETEEGMAGGYRFEE